MGFVKLGPTVRGLRAPEGQSLLRQTYESTPLPDGVLLVPQRVRPDDWGGSFKETARLDDGNVQAAALHERGVALQARQLNVSVVSPGTRRFWHVHPTQNELWLVAHGHLNAGLVDCREDSPTHGLRAKVVLTPHQGLYIPTGVAHGYANESGATAVLLYVVDQQWSGGADTEEWRIHPDELDIGFVLGDVI
jgi:dTDP-4-dehydrorhamnose 3,5-epimerase-like enzyme